MCRAHRILVFLPLVLAALPLQSAPPVAAFTNYARYETVRISPGGKHLALTQRTAEGEIMTVLHFPDLSLAGRFGFGDQMEVAEFFWKGDTRLLVQTARRVPGWSRDSFPTGEIIGVDSDGGNAQKLFAATPPRAQTSIRSGGQDAPVTSVTLLDPLPGDAENVLVQTSGFSFGPTPDLSPQGISRMNVRTGKLQKLTGTPLNGAAFHVDGQGHPAFASGLDARGEQRLFRRDEEKREWPLLGSYPADQGRMQIVADTGQADTFIALDDSTAPVTGVVEWNVKTGAKKDLFRHATVDAVPQPRDPQGRAWSFYLADHFPDYWYPDPEHPLARMHQALRATFRDSVVGFTSVTGDMSLAVARVVAPDVPPTFLMVDVKNRKLLQRLPTYPDLEPGELGQMEPFELKARDGLAISGYITTPRLPSRKGLPLVVLVSDGPHFTQTTYSFNTHAQLLASRGYAVLQVNYRGTAGRGRVFESAGRGRWGTAMQDDLTDAVKWAIADGVADRDRVCIVGSGYGAYAALTGAFREPGMFRCAVGINGIYDLPLWLRPAGGFGGGPPAGDPFLRAAIGSDTAELRRRSPAFNADRISADVMLVHARTDVFPPYAQTGRMVEALGKAGRNATVVNELGGGEGEKVNKEAVMAQTHESILAFLAQHLGPATGQ